ncbi:uncharacterized protein GLRG_03929 [Colletotrichum graminicola M1.001]|uniref:Uncharacterized protein n=1 Tax=Colletotrichum graminicola (strain M1.001 / M2 / FGSC 10212) TaxID=645133 RepID=E3QD13_COLGM|nr:uncharacterized protein GLRG_03929 [Colletotrichum graminicola M1.001]EFQ28785.1 hypothetical protein GLRG_03929 [Colletotrichum graminicola M1.001]
MVSRTSSYSSPKKGEEGPSSMYMSGCAPHDDVGAQGYATGELDPETHRASCIEGGG